MAGKAHPHDEGGKRLIERARPYPRAPAAIRIAFLPNYDMELAQTLVAGVDVWLNTPLPPLEASGTSGMKAAFNGVPNLSVLDGWWVEGCIEGVTGWAIGRRCRKAPRQSRGNAEDLYHKLEYVVLPLYYNDRGRWIWMMKQPISKIASYFNTPPHDAPLRHRGLSSVGSTTFASRRHSSSTAL